MVAMTSDTAALVSDSSTLPATVPRAPAVSSFTSGSRTICRPSIYRRLRVHSNPRRPDGAGVGDRALRQRPRGRQR